MSDFDFDAHPLGEGETFFNTPDPQGKFMAGFGRARRNRWIEMRQPDLAALLAQAHRLYKTDDPDVAAALTLLAKALDKPQPLTFAEVMADPHGLGVRYLALIKAGKTDVQALDVMTAERDQT
jgi:hypothetical protein